MRKRILSKAKLILEVDILLVLLFLGVPMILYLNNLVRGVFFTWPIFVIWLCVVIVKGKKLNEFRFALRDRRKEFALLLLFLIIVLLNYIFVNDSDKAFQYCVVFVNYILILIIDAYYSRIAGNYKLTILFLLILLLGIQAMVSIPYLLSSDTFVVRMLASGQLDAQQTTEAIKHGVGDNGLYTSGAAIVFIGLSVLNRFNILSRGILFCCLLAILFSIIMSTFFASVLMLVIGILILIICYNKVVFSIKPIIYALLISFCTFYFCKIFLSDTMLLKPLENKWERFNSAGGDDTGRTNLAKVSINTFLENPIFGVGVPKNQSYNVIGEHMPWVDFFANFGLLGFAPFLLFLFLLIKRSFQFAMTKEGDKFYKIASIIGISIFILSNFISPMLVVSNMYTMLILFYTSYINRPSEHIILRKI